MREYDSYKPSGIEWIGEIPEHWEIKKFGQISYMKGRIGWQGLKQSEFTQNGDDPFLITGMNFHDGKIRWDEVYHISEDRYNEAPEIQLKENDVLITKDGTIGKLLYVDKIPYPNKASLNSHLLVLRPFQNSYHPRYLYYVLQSLPFKHHVELTKTGTTFYGITQEAMGQFKILIPQLSEQTAIATYLDHKTAEIDELIADKKRMIALYEEEKMAIINQAVTKGINPDVPMKDSGIEWLGEIPDYWEVKRLKSVSQHFKGFAFKSSDFASSGIPVIKASNIKKWEIVNITSFIDFDNQRIEFEKVRLKKGDVILSTVGSKPDVVNSAVGQLASINEDFHDSYLNQNTVCIRRDNHINDSFLKYSFLSKYFRSKLDSISAWIANQAYLEVEDILSIQIPLPRIEEQKSIVHHVEAECIRIDTQIERTRKLIELLTEYRTALISEVVTGKIKVI